jgi:hypothetical protein
MIRQLFRHLANVLGIGVLICFGLSVLGAAGSPSDRVPQFGQYGGALLVAAFICWIIGTGRWP